MLLRATAARIRSKGMAAALAMLQHTGSGAGGDEEAMRQARADGTAWQQRDLSSNDPDVLAGADDPVVPLSLVEPPAVSRLP